LPLRDPYNGIENWSVRIDPFEEVLQRRIIAYLIDLVPICLLDVLASLILSILSFLSFGLLDFLWRLLPLIGILYTAALLAAPGSATIGMRLTRLTIRRIDGGAPSPLQALLFAVLFYVLGVLTGWLILLLPLFTPRHRAAHDLLSGMLVLRSDRAPIF
jgi:uncharacterized RDD family membrane protein YckC